MGSKETRGVNLWNCAQSQLVWVNLIFPSAADVTLKCSVTVGLFWKKRGSNAGLGMQKYKFGVPSTSNSTGYGEARNDSAGGE